MDAEVVKLILGIVYVAAIWGVVWRFGDDIEKLMARISSVKIPGISGELAQTERNEEEKKPAPVPPPAEIEASKSTPPNETEQKRLIDESKSYRELMYYWEYMYLNYFLARGTQELLDWLIAAKQRFTIQIIDRALSSLYPPEERAAMVSALKTHYLLQSVGELLEVTPKGQEYAEFRGPLPPRAPAKK